MVTVEEVKAAVRATGKTFINQHACSICGTKVGYVIECERIGFQSSCGCSYDWHPPERSSWEDLAEWVNMQTDPQGIAYARAECGLPAASQIP